MGRFVVTIAGPGYADYEQERNAFGGLAVDIVEIGLDETSLRQGLAHADVVMVRDTPLDAERISWMTKARGIVRYGVGVDTVDIEAAKRRQIHVANVPDYGADIEVSDHAATLALSLCRRVNERDRVVRTGHWGNIQASSIPRIADLSLGLVGFGRIAKAMKTRMAAFGMGHALVHDPYLPEEQIREAGAEPVSLIELFERADLVSLHAPATGEVPLIHAQILAHAKPGLLLVNTARGKLIDENALVGALQSGRLGGAALDVFAQEPPDPRSVLFHCENVILTDHMGWYSRQSVKSLQKLAGLQARLILEGRKPTNWINPW